MKPVACIVLPTYNEAQNISKLLPEIFAQAEKFQSHELHVLVVDDNSPDGTGDIVKKMQQQYTALHLLTGEKKGLGDAYKRGMAYAIENLNADIIFEMDADFQHDPNLIPLFIYFYHRIPFSSRSGDDGHVILPEIFKFIWKLVDSIFWRYAKIARFYFRIPMY